MPAYDLVDPKRYGMKPFRYPDHMMIEAEGALHLQLLPHDLTWEGRRRPRLLTVLDDMSTGHGQADVATPSTLRTTPGPPTASASPRPGRRACSSRPRCRHLGMRGRVDDLHRNQDLFLLMRRPASLQFLIGFERAARMRTPKRWNKGVNAQKARERSPQLLTEYRTAPPDILRETERSSPTSSRRGRLRGRDRGRHLHRGAAHPLPSHHSHLEGVRGPWHPHELGLRRHRKLQDYPAHEDPEQAQVYEFQGKNMSSFYTDPKKAFHAVTSGKHAARAFSSIILSGLEDAVLDVVSVDRIPPELWQRPPTPERIVRTTSPTPKPAA